MKVAAAVNIFDVLRLRSIGRMGLLFIFHFFGLVYVPELLASLDVVDVDKVIVM